MIPVQANDSSEAKQKILQYLRLRISSRDVSGAGCGRSFNWNTDAIPLTEEELYELNAVKLIDDAKRRFQNQSFKELEEDYFQNLTNAGEFDFKKA